MAKPHYRLKCKSRVVSGGMSWSVQWAAHEMLQTTTWTDSPMQAATIAATVVGMYRHRVSDRSEYIRIRDHTIRQHRAHWG